MSPSLTSLIRTLNCCSPTHGPRISGYILEKVGARSPAGSQSRLMRIILVEEAKGDVRGTCGFGWGKQGCVGPQGISSGLADEVSGGGNPVSRSDVCILLGNSGDFGGGNGGSEVSSVTGRSIGVCGECSLEGGGGRRGCLPLDLAEGGGGGLTVESFLLNDRDRLCLTTGGG